MTRISVAPLDRAALDLLSSGLPHLDNAVFDFPSEEQVFLATWSLEFGEPKDLKSITVDDVCVGLLRVSEMYEGAYEIGFAIAPSRQGEGIATDAVSGFITVRNPVEVTAETRLDNLASQRVLEKCGFEIEATIPPMLRWRWQRP